MASQSLFHWQAWTVWLVAIFAASAVQGQSSSPQSVLTDQSSTQPTRSPAKLRGFAPSVNRQGLGLVPIRPQGAKATGQTVAAPDSSGARDAKQQRIIEQIRSGNFETPEAVTNFKSGLQTIRQRYESGEDQLVRQVKQDENGNFLNHGSWRLYSPKGKLLASGQFDDGQMDGTWERWHAKSEGGIFNTKAFAQLDGPFFSTATFTSGKLNGVWVISDKDRRKIVEVPYQDGQRHGTATWWYPNSQRMLSVNFAKGVLDGPMLQWNEKGDLISNDEFIGGQKLMRNVSMYRPHQRRSEVYFLDAELRLNGLDSWWEARPAEYVRIGEKVQHGPAYDWHPNGQQMMVGTYSQGRRVGRFTWWHKNGQKASQGSYRDGEKVGDWVWWHANGKKSIEGRYSDDKPVGDWTWWESDGQIARSKSYADAAVDSLPTPTDSAGDRSVVDSDDEPSDGQAIRLGGPLQSTADTKPTIDADELESISPVGRPDGSEQN